MPKPIVCIVKIRQDSKNDLKKSDLLFGQLKAFFGLHLFKAQQAFVTCFHILFDPQVAYRGGTNRDPLKGELVGNALLPIGRVLQ